MFTIEVNKESLKAWERKITNRLQYWAKLSKIPLTKKLVKEICPAIQESLSSANNLPTHAGKKAFYDTETEIAVAKRGRKSAAKFTGKTFINRYERSEHLLDCWKVKPVQTSDGDNVILINNTKMVTGKHLDYSLLQILWEGTDYYIAPVHLTNADIALAKKRDVFKHYDNLEAYSPPKLIKNLKRKPLYVGPSQKKLTKYELSPEERQADRDAKRRAYEKGKGKYALSGEAHWKWFRENFYVKPRKYGWRKSVITTGLKGPISRYEAYGEGQGQFARQPDFIVQKAKGVTNSLTNSSNPQLMNFYCRYAGKFYYNQSQRRGIERPMIQEFHDYVADCVYDGFYSALGEIFANGTSTKLMQKVFRDMVLT